MPSPNSSLKSRFYVILIGIALGLLALAIKEMVSTPSEKPVSSISHLQR
ncbi:MAG: hypothetical protein HON92_03765 [Planctomycetaceae bacterium]|jgi:hypothetical protein|nr:hypothetical protein [Planctomycetaceae bacterium]MBT4014039.1 hypothetical protein [Planctomycetaceae bacterium]MBT4724741.1 hypothetical protein [Planctomycetaceae bacterium]MBT4844528.1 hypothetical protein [Planctomycetaceae bacterium]MBT5124347.1 hypothetical protein [Planctomycetaceae bacterium]